MPEVATPRTRQRPVAKQIRSRLVVRPQAVPQREAAATAFLADVLIGDASWRLAEVQNVLALHTLIAVGRWHGHGLDDICRAES